MSKHIYISQLKHEQNASNNIVKKIYNMIINNEQFENVLDNESNFSGEITLSRPTYKVWVDKITSCFPNMIINGLYYILFKDPTVESMMAAHLLSKGVGDGEGITTADASDAKITNLPRFTDNATIEYFDELIYFTRVTYLGQFAFSGCSNLKSIDIQNITRFDSAVFKDCTGLTSITLNENAILASYAMFFGCTNLTEIINIDKFTTIPESLCEGCTSLQTINLSNARTIMAYAFRYCNSLGEVDISKVTDLKSGVFNDCSNLTLANNHLIINHIYPYAFSGCHKLTQIYIPNVTAIDNNAFYTCQNLQEVLESSNVQTIGNWAFAVCPSITTIDTSSVTTFGESAFARSSIPFVDFSSVVTIGKGAFQACSSLNMSNISMPNLTSLGVYAFDGDGGIKSVSNLGSITAISANSFQYTGLQSIVIPNTVKSIDTKAFWHCASFHDLTIPSSVTLIGDNAFEFDTLLTLTNNELPTSITSIGNSAFSKCYNVVIDDLNLPNLTNLGKYAFQNTKIKKISNIGSTINSLVNEIFFECTSLTSIENNALSNIENILWRCFQGCTSLTTLGDTHNLKEINDNAFLSCGELREVDLSNVKNIGVHVFQYCKKMTIKNNDLTNVENLGSLCFSEIAATGYIDLGTKLQSVNASFNLVNAHLICRATTPPTGSSFGNASGYYIYVPDESLDAYKTAFSREANKFKQISEMNNI